MPDPAAVGACRLNTDEIAGSMQDLEQMQASVEELREQMGDAQGGLQQSGEGLLRILEMLQEASHVLAAIRESRKACTVAHAHQRGFSSPLKTPALPCPTFITLVITRLPHALFEGRGFNACAADKSEAVPPYLSC